MTDDATTHTEKPSQPERATSGCLALCGTTFLVIIGLYWLITGEIIIPYQAIFVTGVPARIAAVLWIAIAIGLSFSHSSRSAKSDDTGTCAPDKLSRRSMCLRLVVVYASILAFFYGAFIVPYG
ncbi:MAG: hypothetical protein WBK37_04660, partial [Kiritimatiellia bacterium]|nr:hypothetical protein [Kiritimatiellia bacterium]